MATKTEANYTGDWLLDEAASRRSRKVGTLLSGQNVKCGTVCYRGQDGKWRVATGRANDVHTYTFTGTATAGYFTLTLWHKSGYWVTTAPIAWNETQANVDAAIEAVLGSASVTATIVGGGGSAITAVGIEFSGTGYAATVWPLGSCAWAAMTGVTACAVTRSMSAGYPNEVHTILLPGAMTAGTWVADYPLWDGSRITLKVAWETNIATTITAINAAMSTAAAIWYGAASTGAVTASSDARTFTITYSGSGCAGIPVGGPLTQVGVGSITSTGTGTVSTRRSPYAEGIALADYDASSGDLAGCQFLVRDAVVDGDALIWNGFDPAFTTAVLERLGIIVVNEGALRSRL